MPTAVLLLLAGVGAGLTGSVAGLASLVSYPALLAAGLPPVAANTTNTVALVAGSVGSVSASRVELGGQGGRVRRMVPAAVLGGAAGGALLLLTPGDAFARVVPVLIAAASLAVLVERRPRPGTGAPGPAPAAGVPAPWWLVGSTAAVGVYGGYFGAAAGVLVLALALLGTGDTLPRANALKNVTLGAANAVAAVAFVVVGDVRWAAAFPLALGFLAGGRLGPALVRRAPVAALRRLVAAVGLVLAAVLAARAW